MTGTVSLNLTFIQENDYAILLKEPDRSNTAWISKYDVDYDGEHLFPNMTTTFNIDEIAAIESGLYQRSRHNTPSH